MGEEAYVPREVLLKQALRQVNIARIALGATALAEMPKGEIGECLTCPIARALSHDKYECSVGNGSLHWPRHSDEVHRKVARAWGTEYTGRGNVIMPTMLRGFVERFDCGMIPELREERKGK